MAGEVQPGVSLGVARQGFADVLQTVTGYGVTKAFQAAGNQVVYTANAPYRLALYPGRATVLSADNARFHPSWMLRPEFEVVPFSGRDVELHLLKKWRDEAEAEVAVMLLIGPGGQGKTRFAAHLARDWACEGWLTLRAFGHEDFSGPEEADIPWKSQVAGILVVADYAERWATTDLLTLLRDTALPAGVPARILLLARSTGYWWEALASQLAREQIYAGSLLLPALGEAAEDRLELYTLARNGYLKELGIDCDDSIAPAPPGLETDYRYSLVLTVHMAALAAVLAYVRRDRSAPHNPAELSAFLLHRERESWHLLHEGRRLTTHPEVMAQTVYTATLAGPLRHADGLAALKCARVEHTEEHGQLIRDHARCYPPRKANTVLEPLYPDRLGEDFIALTLPGHADPTYPGEPWATDALARILNGGSPGAKKPPWAEPAKTVITEAAARWPHVAALIGADDLGVGIPRTRHRR
jgi:DNA polymerase III delta prime subunit